ncbi:DUF3533 domain-containing protein [Gordonia sp. ABSL1-1]|uniref:YhgE/Pip domain-containing protein n=1 Tax=Gordonia sp. ABSL1-1 TaxID=3053923 RepID=UPI0025739E78|nr:DUF3533 domain-containing protein [Gordonia sp. ABSL1-1]MDL9935503.1 DUF3533 domain-containing protein [Gordonia sp. ABSL1-1]
MGKHEGADDTENLTGEGEHAAPEPEAAAGRTIAGVLGSPRFWLLPVALVVGLFCLMAALYMGAVVNPEKHLHDFPIALVNEDTGGEVETGDGQSSRANFGDQVADGIIETAARSGIAIHRTDRTTAFDQLAAGEAYGIVVIKAGFTNSAVALGRSAVLPAKPESPAIAVYINRGSGTFASSVTTTFADRMRAQVNAQMGQQLTDTVRGQLVKLNLPFSGAAQIALATPVAVTVSEATELPPGAGNGLSAFYFTLLLILAGFTGAMMVSILVDGMLGQTPIEFGPFYQLRARLAISRWGTLAAKWVIMLLVALVQSVLYIVVCVAVGTSLPNAFVLWAFSTLAIFAVGVSASTMMALFGNPGLILNLVFFVVFGLPSSGGTLPLEASPRIFEWIAAVEPMHVVYLGVRSILYYDADLGAGLGRSVIQCLGGLAIGVLLGWAGTRFYDRKGWHRYPGGMILPPKLDRLVNAG